MVTAEFDHEARIEELKQRKDPCAATNKMRFVHLSYGYVAIEMPILHEMTVQEGLANGGYVVVLMNTAAVYAAMSVIPEGHTRLLESTPRFTNPAWLARVIVAHATLKHESGSFIDIDVDAYDKANGKLIAHGNYMYYKPEAK